MKKEKIYVELDAILDTRYGVLSQLSVIQMTEELELKYKTRKTDEFTFIEPFLTREVFSEKYKTRDSGCLNDVIITGAFIRLREICESILVESFNNPQIDGIELYVNTHPYNLSEDTIEEIRRAISSWLLIGVEVKMLNTPNTSIGPAFLKTNKFSCCIMYNFPDWLRTNTEEFKNNILHNMVLLVPALFEGDPPTEKELIRYQTVTDDPMKFLQDMLKSVVDITMVDISEFCFASPMQIAEFMERVAKFEESKITEVLTTVEDPFGL